MDENEPIPGTQAPQGPEGDDGAAPDGRLYGCLSAASFASIAGFVVMVGTFMGDCAPDQHCHAHDGAILMRGLGIVCAAALALGLLMHMAATFVFRRLPRDIDRPGVGCLAAGVAILVGALAGGYWIEVMIDLGL